MDVNKWFGVVSGAPSCHRKDALLRRRRPSARFVEC